MVPQPETERRQYDDELRRRTGEIFASHPELYDHRAQHPWVLAYLGDPFAPVWFVAENPSLTQAERALGGSTPEDQWNVSVGDKLFREQLVAHGFKTGTTESLGGWRCYITDVVKGIERVQVWNKLPESKRKKVAEVWAPVLAWELELGQPKIVVFVGEKAERLFDHLIERGLIPTPPRRGRVKHYSYIGSRPDARTGLGPRHPARIAAWSDEFAAVAAALHGGEDSEPHQLPIHSAQGRVNRRDLAPQPRPKRSRAQEPIEVPDFVRASIRAGLTPDQVWKRNGRRRVIWYAALIEEARQQGEWSLFAPTPDAVALLRDKSGYRWERIAVRVFGDPRRTTEARVLYDAAKGIGAAKRSYTGRGRRFRGMDS